MAKEKSNITFPAEGTRQVTLGMTILGEAYTQQKIAEWEKEDREKLSLLCEHYGIGSGPDKFYRLALTLARKLHPEPKKRGRKTKWNFINKGVLIVEIERIVNPDYPPHGVEWACTQLANREPWKSFLDEKDSPATNPDPAEALRQVYYGFKNDKLAAICRDAFGWHEHQNTIEEWENNVSDYVRISLQS